MFVIWHLLILEISVTGALACGECKDLMVPSYDGFVIQNPSWSTLTADRVSCLWECYRQPRCRSFQYDYTTGECRWYDEYLANDQSYAGYNSTNDITTVKLCPAVVLPPLLGIPCSTTHHCQVVDSMCSYTYNTCTCSTGLSFNMSQGACVVSCDSYGSQFSVYRNIDSDFSLHMISFISEIPVTDPDDCKEMCLQESSFVCVIAKSYTSQGGYLCDYGAQTWQMAGSGLNVFAPSTASIYIRHCSIHEQN